MSGHKRGDATTASIPVFVRRLAGPLGLIGHLMCLIEAQSALWPLIPRIAWATIAGVGAITVIPTAIDAAARALDPMPPAHRGDRIVRPVVDLTTVWSLAAAIACAVIEWPIAMWPAAATVLLLPVAIRPVALLTGFIANHGGRRDRNDDDRTGDGERETNGKESE